ncbi:MAG: DUF4339 domain-containing protein [Verrucomicrobia bacterium]|nr:DUF4339 domain-containing protein [Verrucomicrobiota bacterium]
MNFFTSREGQRYGPYPIESLSEMVRNNQVVPTDLIFIEGGSNWRTVAEHLKADSPPPLPMGTRPLPKGPPPLPKSSPPHTGTPPPLPPQGRLARPRTDEACAAADATPAMKELEDSVLKGGRFVIFQYCFSVIVMTFKRTSSITFLRADEDGFKPAFFNSLISLSVGWWGIPWGPIWTLSTVFKNAWGGTDVTKEVLTEQLGEARTAQIMAQRRTFKPCGLGMRLFRCGLIGVPVLLVSLALILPVFTAINRRANGQGNTNTRSREAGEFAAANRQINTYRDTVAHGNSPKATAAAAAFAEKLKLSRALLFEGGKKNGLSITHHEFLTYCELRDSGCAFIVHVPELRRFETDAKESLGALAWAAAQDALLKQGITNEGMRLTIGLRGVILYDRVLIGTLKTNAESSGVGLTETVVGNNPEHRLYPFFETVAAIPQSSTSTNDPVTTPDP